MAHKKSAPGRPTASSRSVYTFAEAFEHWLHQRQAEERAVREAATFEQRLTLAGNGWLVDCGPAPEGGSA